jgi:hypothetical protein
MTSQGHAIIRESGKLTFDRHDFGWFWQTQVGGNAGQPNHPHAGLINKYEPSNALQGPEHFFLAHPAEERAGPRMTRWQAWLEQGDDLHRSSSSFTASTFLYGRPGQLSRGD